MEAFICCRVANTIPMTSPFLVNRGEPLLPPFINKSKIKFVGLGIPENSNVAEIMPTCNIEVNCNKDMLLIVSDIDLIWRMSQFCNLGRYNPNYSDRVRIGNTIYK